MKEALEWPRLRWLDMLGWFAMKICSLPKGEAGQGCNDCYKEPDCWLMVSSGIVLIWLVVWNMNFIFPYIGNNNTI